MKKLKYVGTVTLLLILMCVHTAFAEIISMQLTYNYNTTWYYAEEVTIMIDNEELLPEDMPSIVINGRTMLPMRLIVEALGGEAVWNGDTRQVFAVTPDTIATFTIDGETAYQNDTEFALDVPPMLINGRTMLPVRALAEALNLEVNWDNDTRTVYIGEMPEIQEVPEATPETLPEETTPNTGTNNGSTVTDTEAIPIVHTVATPLSTEDLQIFYIKASSPMTNFIETTTDASKIIIDIPQSTTTLQPLIEHTNSEIVSAVRSALHVIDGQTSTRVVFDLHDDFWACDYDLLRNADGTELILAFDTIMVNTIKPTSGTTSDTLEITSNAPISPSVNYTFSPSQITIDIPNVESEASHDHNVSGFKYMKGLHIEEIEGKILRITITIDPDTIYFTRQDGNQFTIEMKESGVSNITYNPVTNSFSLSGNIDFEISDVETNDMHTLGYYEYILPNDYTAIFGEGIFYFDTDSVQSIEVKVVGGKTVFSIQQSQYNAYEMEKTYNSCDIYIKNPKEVYDTILFIDAGHGGQDPGTSGYGLVEKDLNLSLVLKIEKYLAGSGIKIYQSRVTDIYPELVWRPQVATEVADMMISVHHNASIVGPAPNGTETFYMVHENEVGVSSDKLTSKALAEAVQGAVVSALGTTDRGIKEDTDYIILNRSSIPTVLVEIGFLTSPDDAAKVSSDSNQELMAENIANAIIELVKTYEVRY
ncbi:MAG: N-acetylmuramoyl-L-alanine amidase [Bacillota bacterium]